MKLLIATVVSIITGRAAQAALLIIIDHLEQLARILLTA